MAGSPRKEQRASTLAVARVSGLPQPARRAGIPGTPVLPRKVGQQLIPINGGDQLLSRCRNQFHRPKLDRRFLSCRRCGGGLLKERTMTLLRWALVFFLVSIVAGILGFTGISAATADIARFLFYVFVVIFLVLLILALTIFRV
jgi:uncharacterized membrane protein YtjA (UPF0391 family)